MYLVPLPVVPGTCVIHPHFISCLISVDAVVVDVLAIATYFCLLSPPSKFSAPLSSILFNTLVCLALIFLSPGLQMLNAHEILEYHIV